MASTSLVIDREDGHALNEDRLVARLIEAVPASKAEADAAAAARNFPMLASAILAHIDAVLEFEDEMAGDAVFLHMFAKMVKLKEDDEFEVAARDSIAALASASGSAARRLGLLVRLYNIVPNRRGVKLAALVALLRLARENRLLGRLKPFLQSAESIPTRWGLDGASARTLLAEAAVAADALGDSSLAQSLRTAHLKTLQGADAALLREAEPVAEAAAAGFIRAPVASQRSNLPSLDAVKALASSPSPGAAALHRLLTIFSSGDVADLAAFQAEGSDALASAGVSAEDALTTMRLLTLASAAADVPSLSFDDVASAIDVDVSAAERWVVLAMERGLIVGRIDQAARQVTISRAAKRALSDDDWKRLSGRLGAWRSEVDGLLDSLRGGSSAGRARAAAAAAGSA